MSTTWQPPVEYVVPWAPDTDIPAFPVKPMSDGGWIVRGTTDRLAALRAVGAHIRGGDDGSWPIDAARWDLDDVSRVGWFRWNPCNENSCFDGGGHSGHLDYVDGPGRGRWQGVLFY